MALTVKVPRALLAEAAIDQLGHSFRSNGGDNISKSDEVWFPFDDTGENYFTKDAYAICNGYGLACHDGLFYHIFTEAEKDNLVPVDWDYSKDAEGVRVAYEDYFRKSTQTDLGDGTWLFRIQYQNNALTDEDRLTYQTSLCDAELGEQFLTKAEGQALKPVVLDIA